MDNKTDFKHIFYSIDIVQIERSLFDYILKLCVINLVLFFAVFFTKGIESKIEFFLRSLMFFIFACFSIYSLLNRYRNRFISICYADDTFSISYFRFFKKQKINFNDIQSIAMISVNNYSLRKIILVELILHSSDTNHKKTHFFLPLKDVLKVLSVINDNNGTIDKNFEFVCALKEIRTFKSYADVYEIIDRLLETRE